VNWDRRLTGKHFFLTNSVEQLAQVYLQRVERVKMRPEEKSGKPLYPTGATSERDSEDRSV